MPSAVPSTVLAALADARAADGGRPLVTFYDGATGERIELSLVTFTNWVDKIANLLTDELMLDPGQVVHLDLPTHWQSCVAVVGAWTAGLRVSLGAPPQDVAVSVVGPAALGEPSRAVGHVLACSLRPMGGAFTEELPTGWLDFAREVPPQPDALINVIAVGPDDAALVVATAQSTHTDLIEQAVQSAGGVGLGSGGRLITDANPTRPSGLAASLLAPIVMGASVVLVANCDTEQRAAIGAQERATGSFWLTG